ncbi:MAG: superoxide dismutase family protein [Pseudomonadota bacterium]
MNQPLNTLLVASLLILSSPSAYAVDAITKLNNVDGEPVGSVEFRATPHGTLLFVSLHSMEPGVNAFHIHAIGQCDPSFGHAGGHYNPDGVGHGYFNEKGVHAGDMPNLHIPENGQLTVEVFNHQLFLDERLFDEDGASVMIHAGPDDYTTDPSGNAGTRIACGVIERVED